MKGCSCGKSRCMEGTTEPQQKKKSTEHYCTAAQSLIYHDPESKSGLRPSRSSPTGVWCSYPSILKIDPDYALASIYPSKTLRYYWGFFLCALVKSPC